MRSEEQIDNMKKLPRKGHNTHRCVLKSHITTGKAKHYETIVKVV